MKSAPNTAAKPTHIPYEEYVKVCAQMESMQQQLDWFKRQLFGRKSDKHLLDNPDQGHLFAQVNSEDVSPAPKKVVKGYTRSNKQKDDKNVNDTGLRYTVSDHFRPFLTTV
jgi:transposase